MKLFIATLCFLTQIPIPFQKNSVLSDEEFSKGIVYYPFVGLIVGGISFFVFWVLQFILQDFSNFFTIGCAVLCEVLVTGAFHLDGLADSCDGLFSSRKKERMLEIMRDSRVGTNGVIAIFFDLFFKIVLIQRLQYTSWVIILMPIAGKMATPVFMKSQYARKEAGLGSIYLREEYDKFMLSAIFIGAFMLVVPIGIYGIFCVIGVLFFAWLFRNYVKSKIGGMTGDTLGAGAELCELIFLVLFLAGERFYI